jgi:hypothetical protein
LSTGQVVAVSPAAATVFAELLLSPKRAYSPAPATKPKPSTTTAINIGFVPDFLDAAFCGDLSSLILIPFKVLTHGQR